MLSSFQVLSGYLSSFVLHQLERDPQPLMSPTMDSFNGAVLFVDLVNFTTWTNEDTEAGSAEKLSQLLQQYFTHVIDAIHAFGGDVVRFAGDAVIALWPCVEDDEFASVRAVRLATQCAVLVHSQVTAFSSEGLRIVISYGNVRSLHIGGPPSHWYWLLAGEPLAQIPQTKQYTTPNQVVLSHEAWQKVAEFCIGIETHTNIHRLIAIRKEIEPTPTHFPTLSRTAQTTLLSYIPTFILDRQIGAQTAWLGEIRSATVMFVHIPNIIYTATDVLELMQITWTTIQQVLATFLGYMVQFIVDDKGTNIIIAFGLPPYVHEDDPRRAVRSAMTIHQRLSQHGLQTAIGIKTGTIFCGDCGVPEHWEYSIIGNTINLAARIMQVALDDGGGVICGPNTYNAIKDFIHCKAMGEFKLKGSPQPMMLYRPLQLTNVAPAFNTMIGREQQQQFMYELIGDYALHGGYHALFIEGEAGIGKSRLLLDSIKYAEQNHISVVFESSDPIDVQVPFALWRQLLIKLLSFDSITDPIEQEIILTNLLVNQPNYHQRVDIVHQLLGRSTAEHRSSLYSSPTYSSLIFQTLHSLITHLFSEQFFMVVIDDAHWIDALSWTLLYAIARVEPNILLILSSRPFDQPPSNDYVAFRHLATTQYLHLEGLTNEHILEIAQRRLDVRELPPELAQIVQTKAEGNPFFAEELAYTIRNTAGISINDQQLQIDPDVHLAEIDVSRSIERMITSRMAMLDFPTQLTLKVASVIGRSFSVDILRSVFPLAELRNRVMEFLDQSEKFNLIHYAPHDSELAFRFRHAITHDVIYKSLLQTQRQELHHEIGTFLERQHDPTNQEELYQLANHFRLGGTWSKAQHYFIKIGDHSYTIGSYANARSAYTEALWCSQQITPQNNAMLLEILLRLIQSSQSINQLVSQPNLTLNLNTLLIQISQAEAKTFEVQLLELRVRLALGRLYFAGMNFSAAFEHFNYVIEHNPSLVVSDLGMVAESFCNRMLVMRGMLDVGKERLESSYAALKQAGRIGEASVIQCYIGFAVAEMGDYQAGIAMAEQILEQLSLMRFHLAWSASAITTMITYWQGCNYQATIELADMIIAQARMSDDKMPLYSGYALKAWAYFRDHDVINAQATLDEFYTVCEQTYLLPQNNSWLLGIECELLISHGFVDQAIDQLTRGIAMLTQYPNFFLHGIAYALLGKAYATKQYWDESTAAYTESLKILHDHSIKLEYAHVLTDWSQDLREVDSERAEALAIQAQTVYQQAGIDPRMFTNKATNVHE